MNKRYENIDFLRFLASFGIVMVHVLKNIEFSAMPSNIIYSYISSVFLMKMEKYVSLFFLISGFSISCGYYNRIKNNDISMNRFYIKRYSRILPLFAVIVVAESLYLLVSHNMGLSDVFFESIADVSLGYAFLPFSSISVVGVGWALGVIFSFYILFPFIVFCTWTKRRSWFVLLLTILLSYGARTYFTYKGAFSNCNFVLWSHYFIAGVIIYLYKDSISILLEKEKSLCVLLLVVGYVLSFTVSFESVFIENVKNLLAWSLVLISTLGKNWKITETRVVKVCSQYSFDIYLLHMLVLRLFQKTNLLASNGVLSMLVDTLMVFSFALCIAFMFGILVKKISRIEKKGSRG